MRWTVVVAGLTALCSGCVTMKPEEGWSPTTPGCAPQGLVFALAYPEAASLGMTDLRIGRLPDTGSGPGQMARFDRNLGGGLTGSIPTAPPQLVLSVGDLQRTCTVVLDEQQCLQAGDVYRRIIGSRLPVAQFHEEPNWLTVTHGTEYFLLARDGRSGVLDWRYVGAPAHEMETAIDAALNDLANCFALPEAMFNEVA